MGKPAVKKKPLPKGVVEVDLVIRVHVNEPKWRAYWATKEDMTHEVTAAHVQRKVREMVTERFTALGVHRDIS